MKRYDIYTDCFDHMVHEETADGEWVRYDDAQAEIARLREVLNDLYVNVGYGNKLRISSKIRAALQRKEGDE